MKEEIVFKDIDKLCTPVGQFVVESENGDYVGFYVRKYNFDLPYPVGDDPEHAIAAIETDTNFSLSHCLEVQIRI